MAWASTFRATLLAHPRAPAYKSRVVAAGHRNPSYAPAPGPLQRSWGISFLPCSHFSGKMAPKVLHMSMCKPLIRRVSNEKHTEMCFSACRAYRNMLFMSPQTAPR